MPVDVFLPRHTRGSVGRENSVVNTWRGMEIKSNCAQLFKAMYGLVGLAQAGILNQLVAY